jgi:hypothetical protein
MDSGPQNASASSGASGFAIYFDGASSRRRLVTLEFNDRLEIREYEHALAAWSYTDVRLADSPSGTLRVTCLTAPALARLEIRDTAVAAELSSRCTLLDENIPGRYGIARIVGWSLAATASIVAVVLFGVPLAADRLTPLVPQAFERRLGDVAEGQVKTMFGGKICDNASGQAAFTKLVNAVRESAGLDTSVQSQVLSSPIPNAFALPGGKVYVFNGLLASRWHAQPDLQWWHVVSDRVVVRRHYRLRRVDLCFALARDRVIFARGGAKCRYICDRCDAQAWPFAKADGRIDVSRDREGRRQELVHPGEPSADGGPRGAHGPRGSAAEWPAAADGGRMDVAQGNLQFKELI